MGTNQSVSDRRRIGEVKEGEDGVYLFQSKPTIPRERTADLLVRFQAVTADRTDLMHEHVKVNSGTLLSQIRRIITRDFTPSFQNGFIFLNKGKEVKRPDEQKTSLFDILPKLPLGKPNKAFQFPSIHYKEVSCDYDGERYTVMCACVVFVFEQSTVSHWAEEKLFLELSANSIPGFAFIPSDMLSWTGDLVEMQATTLHMYAAIGETDNLKNDIEHIAANKYNPVFLRDHRHATPLHYAAQNGHLDTCEFIVTSLGKDFLYYKDINGKTPLHLAFYWKRFDIVAYFLQFEPDMRLVDVHSNSCTDLLLALNSSQLSNVFETLEIECVTQDVMRYFAFDALRSGNVKVSRKLTTLLQPDDFTMDLGRTPLHLAVNMGDLESVMNLINNGFDKTRKDNSGLLPLHLACKSGHVKLLDKLYFDKISDEDLNVGFRVALRDRQYSVLQVLLTQRPEVRVETDIMHKVIDILGLKMESVWADVLPLLVVDRDLASTFLLETSRNGLSGAVKLLISIGARVNIQDMMGRTAMHEASQMGHSKIVKLLLERGADPNKADYRNSTPLHYACSAGQIKTVKVLMNFQNVNGKLQDINGRTALLEAANRRRHRVVKYLVKEHLNRLHPFASDIYGYTIQHYTVGMRIKTVDLLLSELKNMSTDDSKKTFPSDKENKVNFSLSQRDELAWESLYRRQQETRYECSVHTSDAIFWGQTKEKTPFKYTKETRIWKRAKIRKKKALGRPPVPEPFTFTLKDRSEGLNSLHVAALGESNSLVQLLLEYCPEYATQPDQSESWPITIAIRKQSIQMITELLNIMKAKGLICPLERCFSDSTWKVERGKYFPTFDLIMAHHISCNTEEQVDHSITASWLMEAVTHNSKMNVKRLLHYRLCDSKGLCAAVNQSSSLEIRTMLLEYLTAEYTEDTYLSSIAKSDIFAGKENEETDEGLSVKRLSYRDVENLALMRKYMPALFKGMEIEVISSILHCYSRCWVDRRLRKSKRTQIESAILGFLTSADLQSRIDKNESFYGEDTDESVVAHVCYSVSIAASEGFWKIFNMLLTKAGNSYWKFIISGEVRETNVEKLATILMRFCENDGAPTDSVNKFIHGCKAYLTSLSKKERKHFEEAVDKELNEVKDDNQMHCIDSYEPVTKLIAIACTRFPETFKHTHSSRRAGENVLYLLKMVPMVLTKRSLYCYVAGAKLEDVLRLLMPVDLRPDSGDASLLHIVCGTGNLDLIKGFTKQLTKSDINQKAEGEFSPLNIAASFADVDVVSYLLGIGAVPDNTSLLACCVWEPWRRVNRDFKRSIEKTNEDRLKILQMILQKGDNVSFNCESGLPLLSTIEQNRWDILRYMLENWVDIKYLFKECNSSTGKFRGSGRDVMAKANAWEELAEQANAKQTKMFYEKAPEDICLKLSPYVVQKLTRIPISCLVEACIGAAQRITAFETAHVSNAVFTQMMVDLEANIDRESLSKILTNQNEGGKSLLHVLSCSGRLQLMKITLAVLDKSIDPLSAVEKRNLVSQLDGAGRTPLWYALRGNYFELAELLYYNNAVIGPHRVLEFVMKRRKRLIPEKAASESPNQYRINSRHAFLKRNKSTEVSGCLSPDIKIKVQQKQKHKSVEAKTVRWEKKTAKRQKSVDFPKKIHHLSNLSFIAEKRGCSLLQQACTERDVSLVKSILKLNPNSKIFLDKHNNESVVYAVTSGSGHIEAIFLNSQKHMQTQILEKCILEVACRLVQRHIDTVKRRRFFNFLVQHLANSNPDLPRLRVTSCGTIVPNINLDESHLIEAGKTLKTLQWLFFFGRSGINDMQSCKLENLVQTLNKLSEQCDVTKLSFPTVITIIFTACTFNVEPAFTMIRKACKKQDFASTALFGNLKLMDIVVTQALSSSCSTTNDVEVVNKMKSVTGTDQIKEINPSVVLAAANSGHWEIPCLAFESYLKSNGEIKDYWWTVLIKAAQSDSGEMFMKISESLDIDSVSDESKAKLSVCLYAAQLAGSHEAVDVLLKYRGVVVQCIPSEEFANQALPYFDKTWGPLHYASRGGNLKCIQSTARAMKEFSISTDMRIIVECLTVICQKGHQACYENLLKFARDSGLGELTDSERQTLLLAAARNGHEQLALSIIASGHVAALKLQGGKQPNALHYAGIYGMTKLAEAILKIDTKALLVQDTFKNTPVHYAWMNGNISTMNTMIKSCKQGDLTKLLVRQPEERRLFGILDFILKHHDQMAHHDTIDIQRIIIGGAIAPLSLEGNWINETTAHCMFTASPLYAALLLSDKARATKFLSLAASNGCLKTLPVLIAGYNEQGINLHDEGHEGMIPAAYAVLNKHKGCTRLLLQSEGWEKWRHKKSQGTILHLAVQTGDENVVTEVLHACDSQFAQEKDAGNLTATAVAVGLGLHKIARLILKDQTVSSERHIRHDKEKTDYTCVECLFDFCFGWSRVYLRGYECSGHDLREVKSFREGRGKSYGVYIIPIGEITQRKYGEQHLLNFVLGLVQSLRCFDSAILQSVLYSMGIVGNWKEAVRILLIIQTGSEEEALRKCLLHGPRKAANFLANSCVSSGTLSSRNILATGTATGHSTILPILFSALPLSQEDATLPETAFAFGYSDLGLQIEEELAKRDVFPVYDNFKAMLEIVPPQIQWLTKLSVIGDEAWISSLVEPSARLSFADAFLALMPNSKHRALVEKRGNTSTIIPSQYKERKINMKMETFRKNSVIKESGSDVWLRCFLASQHVFGRICYLLDSPDHRLSNATSVQVTCLSDAYGEPSKTTAEVDGSVTEALSVKKLDGVATVLHDPMPEIRRVEQSERSKVANEIIPELETKLSKLVSGRSIKLRVDWRSVDSKRSSDIHQTILRALSGDEFGNPLGGLWDVIAECEDMVNFIENMYNKQTAELMTSRIIIKEIAIKFVDKLPELNMDQTSALRTVESDATWNFTITNGVLKYDRSSLALWSLIQMYYSVTFQIANSCMSISNAQKDSNVVLELDFMTLTKLRSHEMIKDLFRIDVWVEMSALALALHSLKWYSPQIDRIKISLGSTRARSSVSISQNALTLELEVLGSGQKLGVDKIDYDDKLLEMESRYLIQNSPKDFLSSAKLEARELETKLMNKTGLEVKISIDESRILVSSVPGFIQNIQSPSNIVENSTLKVIRRLEHFFLESLERFLNIGPYCKYWIDAHLPNAIWYIPSAPLKDQTDYLILEAERTEKYSDLRCRTAFKLGPNMEPPFSFDIFPESLSHVLGLWKERPLTTLTSNSAFHKMGRVQLLSCNNRLYRILDLEALHTFANKFTEKKLIGPNAIDAAHNYIDDFFEPFDIIKPERKSDLERLILDDESMRLTLCPYPRGQKCIAGNLVMNVKVSVDLPLTGSSPGYSMALSAFENTLLEFERKWHLKQGSRNCDSQKQNAKGMLNEMSEITTIFVDYGRINKTAMKTSSLGRKHGERADVLLSSPQEMHIRFNHFKYSDTFLKTFENAMVNLLELKLGDMIYKTSLKSLQNDAASGIDHSQSDSGKLLDIAHAIDTFGKIKRFISVFKEYYVYQIPIKIKLLKTDSEFTSVSLESNVLSVRVSSCEHSFHRLAQQTARIIVKQKATKRRPREEVETEPFLLHVRDAWRGGILLEATPLFSEDLPDGIAARLCDHEEYEVKKGETTLSNELLSVERCQDGAFRISFQDSTTTGIEDNSTVALTKIQDIEVKVCGQLVDGFLPSFVWHEDIWSKDCTKETDSEHALSISRGGYFRFYVQHDDACSQQFNKKKFREFVGQARSVYRCLRKTHDIDVHLLFDMQRNSGIGPLVPCTIDVVGSSKAESGFRKTYQFKYICTDRMRQVRITSSCRQCGMILKMWTPFEVVNPREVLTINLNDAWQIN